MSFGDQSGTQAPRGLMVLKPEWRERRVGDRTEGFALFSITQSGCQVRIYPELDANGQAMPIRTGRQLRDVGNWVCGDHYGIRFLGGNDPGKEKITMLLTIKGDEKCSDPSQRRGLRIWDQLRNTLYYRLNDGSAPSHWSRWAANVPKATLGPSSKSKAKIFALVRGLLTLYVGQEGRPIRSISAQSPKLNCILLAPPAAQAALVELTMRELDSAKNYNGDDYDQVFLYNKKLVHPETGCLINFGGKGSSDPRVAQQARASSQVNFNSSGASSNTNDDDDQYKVEATVLDFPPYSAVPIPDEYLRRFCTPAWEDFLQIWPDEAALVSALEVGIPDDLIIAAFKDEPHLLSERLLAKMRDADRAARAGSLGVPGNAPSVPHAAPAPSPALAPMVNIPGADQPAQPVIMPANNPPPAQTPSSGPAPWENNNVAVPAVNIPGSMPTASAVPAANPAPEGSQPNGTDAQGMEEMLQALKNANPAAGNQQTGT